MFNKVILLGNLTRDVELRYLPSGQCTAKIGLATTHKYKKSDGTPAEDTCFVDATLWGRTAEIANQYLKKGSPVLIEGRLVLESWTDQSGQKRSKHSITAESLKLIPSGNRGGNGGSRGDEYDNGSYGDENYGGGYNSNGYGNGGYNQNSNYNSGNYGGANAQNRAQNSGYSNNSYSNNAQNNGYNNNTNAPRNSQKAQNIEVDDDDIPF